MDAKAKKKALRNISKKISRGEKLSEIEGNILFYSWMENAKPEDPLGIILKFKGIRDILLVQLGKYGVPGVKLTINELLGVFRDEKSKKAVKSIWAKMYNDGKEVYSGSSDFLYMIENIKKYSKLKPYLRKSYFLMTLSKTNRKAREKFIDTVVEELGLVLRVFKALDSTADVKKRNYYY